MIEKIQNVNPTFGKLIIDKSKKSTIPLSILASDEAVRKELDDTFEKIDKASGEHKVNFWGREGKDYSYFRLSSVHWQKILPVLRIDNNMEQENKIEAIKEFKEKALRCMSIENVPDISNWLNKYS